MSFGNYDYLQVSSSTFDPKHIYGAIEALPFPFSIKLTSQIGSSTTCYVMLCNIFCTVCCMIAKHEYIVIRMKLSLL